MNLSTNVLMKDDTEYESSIDECRAAFCLYVDAIGEIQTDFQCPARIQWPVHYCKCCFRARS